MKSKVLHVIIGLILATALFVAMGHAKQKGTGLPGTTTATVKTGKSLKATTQVTRRNTILHVLSNLPKGLVAVVRVVTDTGEYVTGKIHDGFVEIDSLADEYVEGQTQ